MNSRAPIARLKKRQQFLDVARGRKWAMPGLVLQASTPREAVLKNAGDENTSPAHSDIRAGFTVTKKVGNAVIRNRARRRLKEAARLLLPLHAKSGYDYVLVGRAATLTRPWTELLDDLRIAFAKAHNERSGGENGAGNMRARSAKKSPSDRIQPPGQSKHG